LAVNLKIAHQPTRRRIESASLRHRLLSSIVAGAVKWFEALLQQGCATLSGDAQSKL